MRGAVPDTKYRHRNMTILKETLSLGMLSSSEIFLRCRSITSVRYWMVRATYSSTVMLLASIDSEKTLRRE